MTALEAARRRARKAVESLYEGCCTIVEYKSKKDPVSKITATGPVAVLEEQPCRVSYTAMPVANQSNTANSVTQVIKLFIAPEINISPGSKIIVTQNDRTEAYKQSGKAAVYPTHQEINLELYEERA